MPLPEQYGTQVGVIVLGAGFNARTYVEDAKKRGLVPVWRDGYVTLHVRK